MAQRLDLQSALEEITANVYFQPPASMSIQYPCIVYERDRTNVLFAGNKKYRGTKRYQVTVIDRNPDSAIPDQVGGLPLSSHDRYFSKDNLHHDVFTVFF